MQVDTQLHPAAAAEEWLQVLPHPALGAAGRHQEESLEVTKSQTLERKKKKKDAKFFVVVVLYVVRYRHGVIFFGRLNHRCCNAWV